MLEHHLSSGDARSFSFEQGRTLSDIPTKVEKVIDQGGGKVTHKVTVYAKEVPVGNPPHNETKYFVRYARGRGTAFSKYVHAELTSNEVRGSDCREATFERKFERYDVPGMSKPMNIIISCSRGQIDLRIVDTDDEAPKMGGGSLRVAEFAEQKHGIVVPPEGEVRKDVPQAVADLIHAEVDDYRSPTPIEERLPKPVRESVETEMRTLESFRPAGMINTWEGYGFVSDSEVKRIGRIEFHGQYGIPRGGSQGGEGMDYRWVALVRGKRRGPTQSYFIGSVANDGAMSQDVELKDGTIVRLSIVPTGNFHFSEIHTSDDRRRHRAESEERQRQSLYQTQINPYYQRESDSLRREEDTLRTSEWNDPFGFLSSYRRRFSELAQSSGMDHSPSFTQPHQSEDFPPELPRNEFGTGTLAKYDIVSSDDYELHPFFGLSLLSSRWISFGYIYRRDFNGDLIFFGEVRGDRAEYTRAEVAIGDRMFLVNGDGALPGFHQEAHMERSGFGNALNLQFVHAYPTELLPRIDDRPESGDRLGAHAISDHYGVHLVHAFSDGLYRHTRVTFVDRLHGLCYEVANIDETQNFSQVVQFLGGKRYTVSLTAGRINEFRQIADQRDDLPLW